VAAGPEAHQPQRPLQEPPACRHEKRVLHHPRHTSAYVSIRQHTEEKRVQHHPRHHALACFAYLLALSTQSVEICGIEKCCQAFHCPVSYNRRQCPHLYAFSVFQCSALERGELQRQELTGSGRCAAPLARDSASCKRVAYMSYYLKA
jgi:hypothetical protein